MFPEKVLQAQYLFGRADTIPVIISGNILKNPWAGGLNQPQFSMIDLDGNGIKDLFVFDRSNLAIRTFINKGTQDSVDYVYAPEYISAFPNLHDFNLLADYNCDGKEDIFGYSNAGMAVYRNDFDSITGLKFTLVTNLLYSKYYSSYINLFVSPANLPALTDIDNDGDLDILTFDIFGMYVEYHQNMSMETFGHCDSLKFQRTSACWGSFLGNSTSNSVTLHISCKADIPIDSLATDNTLQHSGSTLLTLDMDGDGDKELVIGDVLSNNLLLLTNGGTPAVADMTAQDGTFPKNYNNTDSVNLSSFPASYYLDVDNDSINDLLVAPNAPSASENFTGILFFKNTGSTSAPVFHFVKNSFLQDEMIETGEGNYPVFFDYDGDGLKDLIIGNYGYFNPSGNFISELSLYKNNGTSSIPSFQLVTRDYANISSLGLNGVYPAFGDLDGDGDEDMILGDYAGEIHFFTNTAPPGNSASFTLTASSYKGIDVGDFAAPQLADLNRDGLQDLIIGKRNGMLSYFQNLGTTGNADFSSSPTIDSLGGVNVREQGNYTGYSIPFLTDSSGSFKLFVGSERGYVYLYDHIDGNIGGTFSMVDSMIKGIQEGNRVSVSGADINNDNKLDLVVGNYQGGCAIYLQNITGNLSARPVDILTEKLTVVPNPCISSARLTVPGDLWKRSDTKVVIYDIFGRKIKEFIIKSAETLLSADALSKGIYIVEARNSNTFAYTKFIIE